MLTSGKKLGVIGAGVMGQALIKGLLNTGSLKPAAIWAAVKTESSATEVSTSLGIKVLSQQESQPLAETEVLLLCVKPSGLLPVLTELGKAGLPENVLLISIVTGHSIAAMQKALGKNNPIIRSMPNTPAIVGEGMTVISPGKTATPAHVKIAHEIFEAVGECVELDEDHLNAVTALSGCGPAYVYLMMEALADGGVRVGLPRHIALQLVRQTVQGAAAMVKETERHPAALRDDVTTPAGCTIGALLILEDGKIRSVLARAVEEATNIAAELGRGSV